MVAHHLSSNDDYKLHRHSDDDALEGTIALAARARGNADFMLLAAAFNLPRSHERLDDVRSTVRARNLRHNG